MYFLFYLRTRLRRSKKEDHLLRVEVSRAALMHNANVFKQVIGDRLLAVVVKSNAYGHGLREVGRIVEQIESISHLVVDSLWEARVLRGCGVRKPILVIGYVPKAQIKRLARLRKVTLVITSLDQARDVSLFVTRRLEVQIKVDTGMRRQGVFLDQLEETIQVLTSNHHLHITGLATHFADADGEEDDATLEQIEEWTRAVAMYRRLVGEGLFHVSATAGTKFVDSAHANMVRLGIGFYGFDPIERSLDLRPALSFWAKVTGIKRLRAGESIGYNFTYTAQSDRLIALIPCGYNEGLWRSLSNRGTVFVQGVPCPIIGRVSMNMTAIDMTDVPGPVRLEDEVEVYSANRQQLNSIENVARQCDTIPYEVLTRISPSIKRWTVL